MTTIPYATHVANTRDGDITFGVWGTAGPVLLCSHGLTANHMSYLSLAEKLGSAYTLIAIDHRGRGRSRDIDGPWGMEHHADDLVACLDALGIDRVDWMIGHSMGGFISAVTKARHRDRIGRVLMIDGGLPLMAEIPAGLTTEQLIEAIVGPAIARLDRSFESVDDYRAFWQEHPALGPYWNATLDAYLTYDLWGEAPALRPTARKDAVLGDTESQLVSSIVADSLAQIDEPVYFQWAPRGMFDGDPLYPEDRLDEVLGEFTQVVRSNAEDVNHYTVLASPAGATQIATLIGQHTR